MESSQSTGNTTQPDTGHPPVQAAHAQPEKPSAAAETSSPQSAVQPAGILKQTAVSAPSSVTHKKGGSLPAALYCIFMLVGIPLNLIGLFLLIGRTVFAAPGQHKETLQAMLIFYLVCALIYWVIALSLGIFCIVNSFIMYGRGNAIACLNSMLILKYGLMAFYIVNVGGSIALFSAVGLIAAVLSRGLAILMLPILFPGIAIFVCVGAVICWLVILPGSFYGLQVVRFSLKEKRISIAAAVIHALLQFTFVLDVFDAMYLSVRKWHRGKKSAAVIGILFLLCLFQILKMYFHYRALAG